MEKGEAGNIRGLAVIVAAILLTVVLSLCFDVRETQAGTVMPGAAPGFFQAGTDGAAEYFVPLRVPPGTGGLRPELSLRYNSRKGDGPLGMGWTIQGLRVISRCRQATAAKEIKAKEADVEQDKKTGFCLDGRILIRLNKESDAPRAEYKTEIDVGEKIVSHEICGRGPCYFTLRDQRGNRSEFGLSTDSRLENPQKDEIRAWAVNRITDRNGNYLRILYHKDSAAPRLFPDEIKYTGNEATGLRPRRSVLFFYEDRRDITIPRAEDAKISKRVKKILTKVEENIVKEYRFAYEYSPTTRRSRLTELKECDDVGDCLSPTSFRWKDGRAEPAPPQTLGAENIINSTRLMTDINGDGALDYVYVPSDSSEYRVIFNDGNAFDMAKTKIISRDSDILKSVSNGLGGRVVVNYKPISHDSSQEAPLYVVSQHTLKDERGNAYTFERRYAGLKIDRRRGFVGFAEIRIINRRADRETVNIYHREFPYSGMLKQKIVRTPDKTPLKQSAYFYSGRKNERGVWQVNLTATTEKEKLSSEPPTRVRLEYQYDAEGRPTIKFNSRKRAGGGEEIHTCLAYRDSSGDDWWKSRPATEEKTTRERKSCLKAGFSSWQAGVDVSRKRFGYDSKMNLTSRKLWDDGKNKWLETNFAYDAYGNLVRKIDPWGTTLAITYDAKHHAFPIKKRINQFEAAFEYEPKFGVKLRETDFNDNVLRWTPPVKIDGFGRILETWSSAPDGKREVVVGKTVFSGSENNKGLKVTVYRRSDRNAEEPKDWLWETKYRDGLGRVYKVENKTMDGKALVVKREFDHQGCVIKEAAPYYRPESRPFWDELRRAPVAVKKMTSCRDSGLETWSLGDEFGGPSFKAPDWSELNELETVESFALSIRSDLETSPAGENRRARRAFQRELDDIKLKRDSLGRITSIFKSGSEIASLSYDDGGKIAIVADAKGRIAEFERDSLGRIVKKRLFAAGDYPKKSLKTISRVYDRGANALGKLTSVSAPEATVSFAYDRLGRLKSETTVISEPDAGGREFVVKYRRDFLGRPVEITYPDNSILRRVYTPGGKIHKIQLKEAGENVFRDWLTYGDRSPAGNILSFVYGGGLRFDHAYDSSGRLESVRATAAGENLLILERERDKLGRLTGLVDNSRSAASGKAEFYPAGSPAGVDDPKIEYDDVGAVKAKGNFRYYYDIEGRLVKVEKKDGADFRTVCQFTYGPLGALLGKVQADGSKTFYPSPLYETRFSPLKEIEYVKYIVGAIAVAKRESGETQARYFHRDPLGNFIVVSDGKGRPLRPIFYNFCAAENGLPPESGSLYDSKTGLCYWKGRYYDRETGAFLNFFNFLSFPNAFMETFEVFDSGK